MPTASVPRPCPKTLPDPARVGDGRAGTDVACSGAVQALFRVFSRGIAHKPSGGHGTVFGFILPASVAGEDIA